MVEIELVWHSIKLICTFISAISVCSLLIAILRSPKVRSNTFNLYLVFCLAPDAVYFLASLLMRVAYTVTDVNYFSKDTGGEDVLYYNYNILRYITMWIEYYWVSAILWMSFIVFIQIHKLLVANKQTKRYQPPARKRVIIDSTIVHVVSGVYAAVCTLMYWEYWRHDWPDLVYNLIVFWMPLIPTLLIPALLMAGMCFGVWWNKLLPTNNARYRSLTLFFARLLASAYVMAILYIVQVLLMWFTPDVYSESYEFRKQVFYCIFYLIGAFQLCLALTKKDIRVAFVDMWCCRKDAGVMASTTTFGGSVKASVPTVHESHHHKDDNCDDDVVEPPAVDEASSPEADSSVENKDIRISGNDEEACTAFVDSKD